MMRTPENVRGTLPVVELINEYGFNAAIAVNNVGNAFTPYGNCDPLVRHLAYILMQGRY
jgi:hypothetical protein